MPVPRVVWQEQEWVRRGGELSPVQRQDEAEQSRGVGEAGGDHMVIDAVTSVKPRCGLEVSTSIWAGACSGLQEKAYESLGHSPRGRKGPRPSQLHCWGSEPRWTVLGASDLRAYVQPPSTGPSWATVIGHSP